MYCGLDITVGWQNILIIPKGALCSDCFWRRVTYCPLAWATHCTTDPKPRAMPKRTSGRFDLLTADSTTTARRAVGPQKGNLCQNICGLKVKPSMSDTGEVMSINCRKENAYAESKNPRNLNLLVFSLPPRGARDSWKSYTNCQSEEPGHSKSVL